jgi:hypothetical protein
MYKNSGFIFFMSINTKTFEFNLFVDLSEYINSIAHFFHSKSNSAHLLYLIFSVVEVHFLTRSLTFQKEDLDVFIIFVVALGIQ